LDVLKPKPSARVVVAAIEEECGLGGVLCHNIRDADVGDGVVGKRGIRGKIELSDMYRVFDSMHLQVSVDYVADSSRIFVA